MLDTNVVVMLNRIDPAELPHETSSISAITLAELSAGPHDISPEVHGDDVDAERARRLDTLQRAGYQFEAIPFDAEAARVYGVVAAAVVAVGRKPRGRALDLLIAATAIAARLPLFTTDPDDFAGLDALLQVVPVTRPPIPPAAPTG